MAVWRVVLDTGDVVNLMRAMVTVAEELALDGGRASAIVFRETASCTRIEITKAEVRHLGGPKAPSDQHKRAHA